MLLNQTNKAKLYEISNLPDPKDQVMIDEIHVGIDTDRQCPRNVPRPPALRSSDGTGVDETFEKTPIRIKDPDCRDTP